MDNKQQNGGASPKGPKFNYFWIYGVILLMLVVTALQPQLFSNSPTRIDQKQFESDMLLAHDVDKVVVVNDSRAEVYLKEDVLDNEKYSDVQKKRFNQPNTGPHYWFKVVSGESFKDDMDELQAEQSFAREDRITVESDIRRDWFSDALVFLGPLALIIILWIFIMRRVSGGMGGPGGQIFNIGKSKATLFDKDTKVNITFDDVAGLDEAKGEVMEIVDFLKSPKKYTKLGGKIPKGALLIGPPGTGKTLLAKAMAGEAQVPFFTISGSDFVEMFVGVGASRVRDLFKQAREKAPCIIFIDEIDAIGRARGKSIVQGNDERENTLNQLLVEMDGFSSEKGVIMIAATNRPDVLDSALLRPGRFDRQIAIDKPDLKGRMAIFQVHLKSIKLSDTVDPEKLASMTPGFVGADIANICNEAALIAARKNKSAVEMDDFNDAVDRVIGGLEKKNKIISPEEKRVIAYHEAGHAICGWFLEHAHPLVKVSIVPRGVAALGYAQYLPKEKYIEATEEILDRMCMTLGGRAAEKVIFDKISTGAQSDLDHVTKTAYAMVAVYGMSEKVGNVSFYNMMEDNSFNKPYSDETARQIDVEARSIIEAQYERAIALLIEKRDELDKIAMELLEKEVIFKDDLTRIIGKRPSEKEEEEAIEEAEVISETPLTDEASTDADSAPEAGASAATEGSAAS